MIQKIKNTLRIILILLYTFSLLSTNAQEILTFGQCIDSAFKNNLRIKQQYITEKSYSLNIKAAKDARLPALSAYTSGNAIWGRGIDPSTNTYANTQFNTYNSGLSLDMPLFNGLYHINNIKLKKQDLEKNKSELQKLKNDITIDIAMRYTNVLYLVETIKTIKEQIKNSHANIDFTQKKIDAGALAKREIYKAIAQKENEELNLIRAENDLEINIVELKQILGMDMEKLIRLQELDPIVIVNPNRADFLKKAIEYAPSLQIQKINLEKSTVSLDMVKSSFYPNFSLGGQLGSTYSTLNTFSTLEDQLHNNLSYGLNINANIPIFSRFSTRNKVKESKYNIASANNQIETEKLNLYKTLNKTFLDLTMSRKKYEVSKSSLTSNQINYDTEKIKYEAGRITLQELNIAKSNLFNSITNSIRDKYEYIFNTLVYKIYEGGTIAK